MHNPIPKHKATSIHPAIYMMQQWQLFMDGIDRIISFYSDEKDDNKLNGIEWNRQLSNNLLPVSISEEVNEKMLSVRREKINYQWLRPELLPFIQQATSSLNQLNLFSESAYLVLLVRIQTPNSDPLLSYLFFRNDTSNFGISSCEAQLETSHKAIIGKMASRFGEMIIQNYSHSKKQEELFRHHTRSILENKQLETNNSNEALSLWKNNWLDTYLSERSKRDGFNYVISDNARTKLFRDASSFEVCKKTIDNCIVYICNLYNTSPGDDVLIEESYLVLDPINPPIKPVKAFDIAPSRSNKTMTLLDRLEQSATILHNQGLSITSADVGAHMPKPITAPAISDAMRKNRVRILQLLEQYPSKWPIIRQSFKPITNLISKNNQRLSISS
ncbi:hypothetical protein J1N10_14860 [Carboxylicivirga sp. A043]|uniref:hypothetical protein n=1 Tax=Carboxylicivirga litoralis TaxID=2816963 RepID=UPI0021CAF7E2|nr:hypothetical protein [Carboxylicivirga sp. A043]MCU4157256.1 hypothetical protein [Carboxylicivirga sp. A043]